MNQHHKTTRTPAAMQLAEARRALRRALAEIQP